MMIRSFLLRDVGFLLWSWIALAGGVAHGADIEAEFNVGVGRSDNIARTSDNEIDEVIGVAGFNFALIEETRRLSADIRSQFDYLYYEGGTFDNEWVGGLSAILDINLIEERLTWIFRENFGQQNSDPLDPARPGNRENVNYFTTGPTLSLLPGSRNLVEVDLLYSSVNFEERDTDNERISGALRIGREIRRGATLSLNAMTERVEFDNDGLSPDFDSREGFVRYELFGNRNIFGIDLGYTEIDVDGETGDGVLLRIDWSREVSASATFRMSGGSNYSDQGNIFRFYQDITSDIRETTDSVETTEPFTNNFFQIGYGLNRDRTSVNVSFNWNQEDYDGSSPDDRESTSVDLDLRRDFTPNVYGRFRVRYQRRDYINLGSVDDDTSVSAEIGYRFGPSSSISLLYARQERDSTRTMADSRENRVFLRFFYTPAWGR